MRAILCGLLLLCSSLSVCAAVYQWVDTQGHTHFSQTPPQRNEAKRPSTVLDPKLGSSKIEAVESGQMIYCGELSVIQSNFTDKVLAEKIQENIDDWLKQRQAASRLRQESRQQQQRYAEQDCRIRWAYGTLQKLRSFKYQADKTYQALQMEYKKLKARQENECSTDPKKLGKTMLVGKEANEWGKCYDHYRYKLRDISKKMQENRRSLRDVK